MGTFDEILKKAKEKEDVEEILKEVEEQYKDLETKYESTKHKNSLLQIQKSQSKAEEFKKSNKNLREKNKKLNKSYNILKRSKTQLAHLTDEQLGVCKRMLDDYNSSQVKSIGKFPGADHPIFNHFYELANQYPNRNFIINSMRKKLNDKKDLIDFEINMQKKNINILEHCAEMQEKYPDTWEDEVDEKEANLFKVTTIDIINSKINQLKQDKKEVDKWMLLKNNINIAPYKTTTKIKNNLYYDILHEFDRLFEFCTNVGGLNTYKANVRVSNLTDRHMHSGLALELQKQLGLCSEFYSRNFFFSNGEGRLIPFKEDRKVLNYIQNNTTFVKLGKNNSYLQGNIIDSDDLFKKVPKFVSKVQYRNSELVGFNNVFYNIKKGEIEQLNPQAPILPLKNTKTELYLNIDPDINIIILDENGKPKIDKKTGKIKIAEDNIIEIENNAMKDIFNRCFKPEDKEALLAYIGCCLYDKGYTQRQESIFLLSRGNTGKTTIIRAICEIFYNWESQLVTKLSDERFGFSMFADNDVVIVDEIQSAKKDFAEVLKNLSTGSNMAIEKKGIDTINLPAENVPRVFFIGNEFSKALYTASAGEGVFRRMLCIIPIKEIQSCGYSWADLTTQSCKQWLVQQATLEYIRQGLHLQDKPISSISDAEKKERLEKCTFPEQFFVKKHFEIAYQDDNSIDHSEKLYYDDFHDFVINQINNQLLEKTVQKGNSQTFIKIVKDVFGLREEGYHTSRDEKGIYFTGIIPKTEAAIEFLGERKNVDGTNN